MTSPKSDERSSAGRDIGRDVVLARPALRQPLEHRVAIRQIRIDGADELPLELQRQFPDEALQHRTHAVFAQEQFPEGLGEIAAQLLLLEFPGNGLHAAGDEQLPEGLRIGKEALLQEAELDIQHIGLFVAAPALGSPVCVIE